MTMQVLLPLVTYPDPNGDAAVARAVAMAARLGAELHVAALQIDILPVSNPFSGLFVDVGEMSRRAEARSREEADRLIGIAADAAAKAGVKMTSEHVSASPDLAGETAAILARYHDVILLCGEEDNSAYSALAEAIIFGAGRPAIVLPAAKDPGPIDHIAVAWDGSRVAARAVADAMPLLAKAKKVSVLTVVNEKPLKETDASDHLADTLKRKGIDAEAVSIELEDAPIATSLQFHAVSRGAGLLVMGGYGHSRLRDFVLGGATAGVLKGAHLPVLISH